MINALQTVRPVAANYITRSRMQAILSVQTG